MNNINKKVALWVVLIISFAVFWGLYTFSDCEFTIWCFFSLLSKVVTFDTMLCFVFEKWLWKFGIFKNWLVLIPDLNGTWQGYMNSTFEDKKNEPIHVLVTIKQSFSTISCVMRTKEMNSYSFICDFIIDKDKQLNQLCYSYDSIPNQGVRYRSEIHRGTTLLNIINDNKLILNGTYWTDRETAGDITLKFYKKKKINLYSKVY